MCGLCGARALGYTDEVGHAWYKHPGTRISSFEEAAEVGTQKVIADHSTIGIVVTTDGSITDLPRSANDSRGRVVAELET